ncbi:peptidoglycan-binding domain-containing protein [Streptomyces sp. NPDC004561]
METRPVPLVAATASPHPEAGPRGFEGAPGGGEPSGPGVAGHRRRRRMALLAAGSAGVAVVAAAGFALLSYHAPARDQAAQEVRESVPDVTTRGPASPTPPGSPSASPPAAPPPVPSATRSLPSSPTPTPTPSPRASRPASPTPAATLSAAPRATPAGAPVLQSGDSGPEVTELQYRLWQLNLYGDQFNGVFGLPVENAVRTYQLARGIQGDPLGVYGPATRSSLESETRRP